MTYKQICPTCNGMGVIKKLSHDSTATYSEIVTCHKCGGEGWVDKEVGLINQTLTGGKNDKY